MSHLRLNDPEPRTLRFNLFRHLPGSSLERECLLEYIILCLAHYQELDYTNLAPPLLFYLVRASIRKLGRKGPVPEKNHRRDFRKRLIPADPTFHQPNLFVCSHIFFETPLSHFTRIEPDYTLGSPWGTYYKALSNR